MPCLGPQRARRSNICRGFHHANQTTWRCCSARYWREIGCFMYETKSCPWLEQSERPATVDPLSVVSLACMTVAQAVRDLGTSRALNRRKRQRCEATTQRNTLFTKDGQNVAVQIIFLHLPSQSEAGSPVEDDAASSTHEQYSIRS